MEYNQVTDQAVAYIRENLHRDLAVETLCREVKVSKNVLYEQFRMSLNTTVSEFVTNCRMDRAKQLLRDTELSLSAVSDSVGINNYTYFIKLFKKRTGLTPLQYRKQN